MLTAANQVTFLATKNVNIRFFLFFLSPVIANILGFGQLVLQKKIFYRQYGLQIYKPFELQSEYSPNPEEAICVLR